MDPRHLELLRDLAAHGSVNAVAKVTHRTPSAVSQQLKVAQRVFGITLVEPDGRGIRLTEAGRFLAGVGQEVDTALARAQAKWDEFRQAPTGTVRIASLPSAATFLLPAALTELAGRGIELVVDDVDVAEHEYAAFTTSHDIVIAHSLAGPTPVGAERLRTAVLAREPLDIAMREGHRLSAKDRVRPGDLVDEQWIGVPPGYPFDSVLLAVAAHTGRDLRVTQRVRDNRLVEALIRSSDHLAVLPRFTTPTGNGLELRPISGIPATRYVVAVMRPDRAERGAVAEVVKELQRAGSTDDAARG